MNFHKKKVFEILNAHSYTFNYVYSIPFVKGMTRKDFMQSLAACTLLSAVTPCAIARPENFYRSEKIIRRKVAFNNQFGMRTAGVLCLPADAGKKPHPAVVVGHPMGAVKEQSALLYAQKLAEAGFVTLAVDLAFWGESAGEPRNSVSPDMYAETFSAAVDFLRTQPEVEREKVGVLGICGSGSFAISAAKIDPRIKAVATVSMYDMGEANRKGLKGAVTLEDRKAVLKEAALQRDREFAGEPAVYTSGTVHEITPDTPEIQKEFFDFYRTPRGEYATPGEDPQHTTHPRLSSNVKFMNFYPFNDIETISPRPMLFIAGDQAHSLEFSLKAYELAAEPKELLLVKGAGHVDLYDRTDVIPFDRLIGFFRKSL
jgi:hypothetical protein